MTSREIVKANIEFACEGRIAFSFDWEGGRIGDMVGVGCDDDVPTRGWKEGGRHFRTDVWGNVWHYDPDVNERGEVWKPVLEDWRDLDRLKLPDLANPAYFERARKLAATEKERFRMGWMPVSVFSTARYMRKMEVYFLDLHLERERVDRLHNMISDLVERVVDQYGQAGLDGIMFAEDLGTQDRTLMSPAMWRDVFRPHYERLTSRAHKYGMKVIQHSCGYNWELIDDLCEAGVDCLQFDQPAAYDMPALAAKMKKHGVGLYAPCDIQRVLPTGNKAYIERETRRLVETFRGGLIAKSYPELPAIGVEPEWDRWAYDEFVRAGGA